MVTYLTNAFSPSMLRMPASVEFRQISEKEFCEEVEKGNHINAIGHQSTIDLVNSLCGSNLKMSRIMVQANVSDNIYIVVLSIRLEEGKMLSREEIQHLYEEGKVRFIRAVVYGAVLRELARCEGVCDQMTYDMLASRAKRG